MSGSDQHGEHAIRAEGLTRRFGSFTAVDRVSFQVPTGTIFGLLGANGAGKSTTIRMLCGLLRPSAGSGHVAGYDIDRTPEAVKRHIGYMSQEFSLYHDLTVEENIRFFGGVYGLDRSALQRQLDWVLEMAGLNGRERAPAGSLSGGWQQRLALGCAVLHDPKVLFLDEPTGGVDPAARRDFWHLINALADRGTTILVTTHYLDEAEYCNQVSLMHAGVIAESGTPSQLKQRHSHGRLYEVAVDDPIAALDRADSDEGLEEATLFGTGLHVRVSAGHADAADYLRELFESAGLRVSRVEVTIPSLEDVFVRVIRERSAT